MVIEFSPFYDFQRTLDQLFDDFPHPRSISRRRASWPPMNISEDEENVVIQCEVPGVNMDELDITLTDSSLSIKGELKAGEGKFYRQERATGLFQRVVNINSPIKRDDIKAVLKDGLLEITLPKAEEIKPKKIAITS